MTDYFKRAVIDLLKQVCIVYIDVGDRTINLALCGVVIILIEILVERAMIMHTFCINVYYDYYVKKLPDGELSFSTITYMIETFPSPKFYYSEHPDDSYSTERLLEDRFGQKIRSLSILDGSGKVKITDWARKRYKMILNELNCICVPVYKHNGTIAYAILGDDTALGHSHNTIGFDRPVKSFSKIFGASELTMVCSVVMLKPQMNKSTYSMKLERFLTCPLPMLSKAAFIHARSAEIYDAIMNFRNGKICKMNIGQQFTNLGIMLHGPPGCGKTTFVNWVCSILGRHCVDIKLANAGWTASMFIKLLTNPIGVISLDISKIVYFFDEFDMIPRDMLSRECASSDIMEKTLLTGATKQHNFDIAADIADKITLDALLTAFDGIARTNGRVVIACTNNISSIDPALLRPGRFGDIILELKPFGRTEVEMALALMDQPLDISVDDIPLPQQPSGFMHNLRTKNIDAILSKDAQKF